MRPLLWNRRFPGHESRRRATQRVTHGWPIRASRTHHRHSREHGRDRIADLIRSEQICEIREGRLPNMNATAHFVSQRPVSLLRPIVIGGAIAGTLDKISGFISFGLKSAQGIAAGLVGRSIAFQGGAATWILGMLLHFFIAFTAAAIYCLASRRLKFLSEHWLVCGLFYGMAVFLVMNLVVLPLSALHLTGPYQLHGLVQGLLVHMVLIGLPISFSLHKVAKYA